MSRDNVTKLMIVLWVILWPIIVLIPNRSNCWYYAIKHKLIHGGTIYAIPSKRWNGHHFICLDKQFQAWEYTYPDMPKNTPWYKLIAYKGIEQKIPNS